MLDNMFGISPNIRKPPSVWYDKGLFYLEQGFTHALNPIVETTLFSFWAKYMQREIIDKPGRVSIHQLHFCFRHSNLFPKYNDSL